MVNLWQPGTQYSLGDEVEFEGVRYKIIQPHMSQGDWTPNVTPALWGREYGVAPTTTATTTQPQQTYDTPEQRPWDQHEQTTVEFGKEEKEKHWYDLTPERRKELEIGGGLLAGAALLGGGFLAYKKHKKNEEEKKAQAWGLQNWMTDAQQRTKVFHERGPSAPATWVLTQGNQIPKNAVVGGQDTDGSPLYIARTFFEGGIHLGKASPRFSKGALIGYDGDEIEIEHYEILLAGNGVRWVQAPQPFNLQSLGAQPVEGGREEDGTPLYIAQAPYQNGTHPGKTNEKLKGANITYGGKERMVGSFNVLVYA